MKTLAELMGGNREPWMLHPGRNCATAPNAHRDEIQVHADQWHPVGGVNAKQLCKGCPVIDECLEYSLEHPELKGVWGATTEERRKQMRRKKVRVA